MSARKSIYDYIKMKGQGKFTEKELHKVSEVLDPGRTIRQLNQDGIIKYHHDKSEGVYNVYEINEYSSKSARTGFTSKVRYQILNRDGQRCQACGKGVPDGVKLHVDHKIPVEWGGDHSDDNLWTLCEECNLGKKSFFKDEFDPKVMVKVFQKSSGRQRLKVLFEESPNKKYSVSILQGIAGIRDWTRTLRDVREKYGLNIVPLKIKGDSTMYYVYVPKSSQP